MYFYKFSAVAIFLVPVWGYKVDYDIGLSYLPASLCCLAGRYDNPVPYSTLSPQELVLRIMKLTNQYNNDNLIRYFLKRIAAVNESNMMYIKYCKC
jgi:hypothetical protein